MYSGKSPLFRKENKTTMHYRGDRGGDYKHERNSKAGIEDERMFKSMGRKKQRGMDYTPLFKFLLSKIGDDWSQYTVRL